MISREETTVTLNGDSHAEAFALKLDPVSPYPAESVCWHRWSHAGQ
jgi:hypothetical protein